MSDRRLLLKGVGILVTRAVHQAEGLCRRIREQGTDAEHVPTFDAIGEYLEQHMRPGDLVVTMGAGDIWKVADEYIQRLGRHR